MSVLSNPALRLPSGDWFHLPPFSLQVAVSEDLYQDLRPIPLAPPGQPGYIVAASWRRGWFMDVSFVYRLGSVYDGLAFQQGLRDALCASDTALSRLVEFSRFQGDGILGTFKRCIAIGAPTFDTKVPGSEAIRAGSFRLHSLDPLIYETATDGALPPESPYAIYYESGGAPGNPPGTLPGGVALTVYTIPVSFDGIAEVTAAGNQDLYAVTIPVWGPNTGAMRISAVQIQSQGKAAGGPDLTTDFVIGNKPFPQSSTASITASLAAGATAASVTGQSLAVTMDSSGAGMVYGKFTKSAGHPGLRYFLKVSNA